MELKKAVARTLIAASLILPAACASRNNLVDEAETLAMNPDQLNMALKYANEAYRGIDTMGQVGKCKLTMAYFHLSDNLEDRGDSASADTAFNRFKLCYEASLQPDPKVANGYYMSRSLHVPALLADQASRPFRP